MKEILRILKNYPSKTVIWLILAILTVVNISYENWTNERKIISWDVNSYYAFLPMVFKYQDMDMDFIDPKIKKFQDHYWPVDTETGKKVIMTSIGMAYLYSPFFLASHGYAHIVGETDNEFSVPYKIGLIISCLFYISIGLIFLRRVLLKYFSERPVTISMLIIVFGTNLLHYVTEEPTMTHAYSFSLISVFLYLVIKWFESPGIKYAILTGLIAGLITLVRPTNIIVIILLVLLNITSFRELGDRIIFYLRKSHLVLIMILAFIVVWIPQFAYWYHVSGSIFLNTYGIVGAGFFFDNPQVYHTLFSYRKGWLLYTPMMILAIVGIYFLYKEKKTLFYPVSLFLILNIYVISSWWCWWYGGGFGMRPFIDSYAIMALPLTAFVGFALRQQHFVKIPILLIIAAIAFVNIFQIRQMKYGALHYVMMTKTSYWEVFLDMTPSKKYWDNLVFPDYDAAKEGRYYTQNEFLELELIRIDRQRQKDVQYYIDKIRNNPAFMDLVNEKAKRWGIPIDSVVLIDADWLYRSNKEQEELK